MKNLGLGRLSSAVMMSTLSILMAGSMALPASAQDALAAQRAALQKFTTPSTTWDGPTSGPILAAGKKIVVVADDMKNPGNSRLANTFVTVAKSVGWDATIADGQGTTSGNQNAITEALSLNPNGIVLISFPDTFIPYFQQARQRGIAVVGLTSAADSGAFPQQGIDWNVMQKVGDLGKALADWVIVKSDGQARAILISDKSFSVVEAKTKAMRDEMKTCATCQIVLDTQVPFSDANTRLPQLVPNWISQYGIDKPLYVLQGADYFVTFEIPPLRSAGVPQGQVVLAGMDGDPSVYQRIRADDSYQEVTIPFPFDMQAYQAVDELNRLFNKVAPADYSSPILLIDKSTVDLAGGKNNEFVPQNGYAEKYKELWDKGSTTP